MKELLGFFEDDWRRVPLNYRYVFFAGVFLIALAWLADHWSDQQRYRVPVFETNEAAFHAGVLLVCIFFLILMVKQFFLWIKILRLRRRYPLKGLGEDFYLVSFQGAIYLLDNKTKFRLHLKTPQTVTDLGFWLLGWTEIPKDTDADVEIALPFRDKSIRWNEYTEIPTGIFTQY
jgi:hypothetical protein